MPTKGDREPRPLSPGADADRTVARRRAAAAAPAPSRVSDAESDTLSAGARLGNYQVVRKLGEGGMGVVYEAKHHQIGSRAAIKILHPEYAQDPDSAARFLNEARAVNIIAHPGLVEIFEYGQLPDGTLYIVMEFLQGESLRHRIEKGNAAVRENEARDLALQLARALSAAHAKGIVHREARRKTMLRLYPSYLDGYGRRSSTCDPTAAPSQDLALTLSPHLRYGL